MHEIFTSLHFTSMIPLSLHLIYHFHDPFTKIKWDVTYIRIGY
jgi:hypothetical protein